MAPNVDQPLTITPYETGGANSSQREIDTLRQQLAIAEALVVPSPCGHPARYVDWKNHARPIVCAVCEMHRLEQKLAAAEEELDLVANSIGTLKLCDDINAANKDAMMAIIVHIDRFLKIERAQAAGGCDE